MAVADLIALRDQLATQPAPALPYVPPAPAPAAPSLNVIPGFTYGGNTAGNYSGAVGSGLAAQLGVTDPNELFVINRESGWNPSAWNKTPVYSNSTLLGHASGLGQLVDTNRASIAKQLGYDPNTMDPRQQLAMAQAYVNGRYGSWANAAAHERTAGWY